MPSFFSLTFHDQHPRLSKLQSQSDAIMLIQKPLKQTTRLLPFQLQLVFHHFRFGVNVYNEK